ncbi:alpha/beta hydrolase family protein [Pseudopedobacter beijingensis]|uniref:Alpha/beta hydrolase family protein n=1 Tax=Pseudopedobacter beijingensis TaxID=1207056 RepID=A0ABW4I911_9SPHI
MMIKKVNFFLFCLAILHVSLPLFGQETFNYDEGKVGEYTLPSLLTSNSGDIVTNEKEWKQRRAEILQLFQENVYGKCPGKPKHIHFEIKKINKNALAGKAISKQVRIFFTKGNKGPYMDVLLYLPSHTSKPVPVFVGLNFKGNQSVNTDSTILLSEKQPELSKYTKKNDPMIRGNQSERWEVETLIENGFATATAYYGDLELDYPEGWQSGIRTSLQTELGIKPDEWGAIGAWAWGLSRITDYLETDKQVNPKKIIVHGHSRLGKAALWAGANDTRFAAVISNNSGEGGAALARRWFGETTNRINTNFPHWFIGQYKTFNNNVQNLPVDQHMLLALIAPRPLYVASATEDLWADPKGEFLSAKNAEPAYTLFGKKGLENTEMPPPDTSIGKTIRYHIRTGKHNILLFDWLQYMVFVSSNLK